jgi:malate dehydrogenase (oxaloacetate-decarboxylating)(NADP+)
MCAPPTINEDMKIAAAQALAELAREDVPDDVAAAYQGVRPRFGPQYIIPVPFDPRLISAIPAAVAKAAMESGVARRRSSTWRYAHQLSARRDPIASTLQRIYERVRRHPRRVVFAEGEEEQVMRAAVSYVNQRLGTAMSARSRGADARNRQGGRHRSRSPGHRADQCAVSRQSKPMPTISMRGCSARAICTATASADQHRPQPFRRLHGGARRCRRHGHRHHAQLFHRARGRPPLSSMSNPATGDRRVAGAVPRPHGACRRHRRHRHAESEELADIAEEAAGMARRLGYEPRVAMLAYSTFGHPPANGPSGCARRSASSTSAASISSMTARWPPMWRSTEVMEQYPFCRLSGTANVLVMPAFHSASISTKMLQELGGSTVIGPLLVGLDKSVQIVSMGAKDSDIVNMAAIAAYNASN